MKNCISHKGLLVFLVFIIYFSFFDLTGVDRDAKNDSSLRSLLAEFEHWKFSEAPQAYLPENLYEYINGAAEIYITYDFKELIVGQYKKTDQEASITVEIYDMGNETNAFGIYSAERFPESKFISIGSQGYLEEDVLNFIVGKYYVKLLCFDCGEKSEEFLRLFSLGIVKRVKDKGQLPLVLSLFPKEGLIQNSEKFILRNFMGYGFLHDGYTASYKLEDLEFDCFFIEGKSEDEAQNMLRRYLDAKQQSIQEISLGYRLKDRYYHNIYLARVKNYICGALKIKDGFEEVGEGYLKRLMESVKNADYY